MISLSADVSIDPALDLWGKTTADLQSNISISNDNVISGTLNYIDDYSSAFGPDLDSGHYIALHFSTNVEGATITVTITDPVTLDPDGILVGRIADKDAQTITVVASKAGYVSTTKIFTLTGLTLTPAG